MKEEAETADERQNHNHQRDDETTRIIIVSPIENDLLPQVCQVLQDSFSTKRCCFIFDGNESLAELKQRYAKMPDAKRLLGAVAMDPYSNDKRVLGYVQMATSGMPVYPMNLHTCKEDELYIEVLGVSSEARGKGVGTKLLEWCLETARNDSRIQRLTLEVLRGNRAIGLYERFGFEIKDVDACEDCCGAALICCLLGRPYGCCHPAWGGVQMEMMVTS